MRGTSIWMEKSHCPGLWLCFSVLNSFLLGWRAFGPHSCLWMEFGPKAFTRVGPPPVTQPPGSLASGQRPRGLSNGPFTSVGQVLENDGDIEV